MLDSKVYGGNLALKFDIKKAFDTIDWNFLLRILEAFGFDAKFCNWERIVRYYQTFLFNQWKTCWLIFF